MPTKSVSGLTHIMTDKPILIFLFLQLVYKADAKYSNYDIDNNWDMVWESNVTFDSEGWIAEFKIPYSALRFPKTEIQTWGLNIKEGIRRNREWYTWSFIDMSKENIAIKLVSYMVLKILNHL